MALVARPFVEVYLLRAPNVPSEDQVVVLWRQRGVTPNGDRFNGEVLGLYRVREGRLARAQMFYFDTAALVSFLALATGQATAPKP
jgi:ketosteroid isomerase-like protein